MGTSNSELEMALSADTYLNQRYRIQKVLGIGGFGITYLALDERSGTSVAIKEYFPFQYVKRNPTNGYITTNGKEGEDVFTHGIHVFKKESQVLKQFSEVDSVVQVMECFDENATSYFVMEFLDGVNAKALMRSMGGSLPIALAEEIMISVATTLQHVHKQGMLHRDISPENIYITRKGQIKLIDFGATRFFVGEKSRSLSVVLKPGFAPVEQYSSKGNQGPWTDIYALCATIYLLVTGNTIPDAPSRIDGETFQPLRVLFPQISKGLDRAVEEGLWMDYRKRPQNMESFLRIMNVVTRQGEDNTEPQQREQPKIQGRNKTEVKAITVKSIAKPAEQLLVRPIVQKGNQEGMTPVIKPSIQNVGMPYLRMIKNGILSDEWQIPTGVMMKVGRSSEVCHIVIDEPGISRIHCTLQYEKGRNLFQLVDVSSNGTYLTRGKLEKGKVYNLNPGDVFHLLSNQIVMKVWVK